LLGDITGAVGSAARAVEHADRSGDYVQTVTKRARYGTALHAAGRRDEAQAVFADVERRQRERQPEYPVLYSSQGYWYCDLQLDRGEWMRVRKRATQTRDVATRYRWLLDIALDELSLGRAGLGLAQSYSRAADQAESCRALGAAGDHLDRAVGGLRAIESNDYLPGGLLARAAFRRALGDWDDAIRDLDEVEEIAAPGPMRLYLCDMALERARLALVRCEGFAPLSGLIDNGAPQPEPPTPAERDRLLAEAAEKLRIAAGYIESCGYHRRDEELAELQAVLRSERSFASLPPRV
jgi:hypothetical protein